MSVPAASNLPMRSTGYHAHRNTRALLVGLSLLLLSCSAAELRQVRTAQLDLPQSTVDAKVAMTIQAASVEQILTGLTLLHLGYAEQDVARWFAELEQRQPKMAAMHGHQPGKVSASISLPPSNARHKTDHDRRIYLAMIHAALLSGSSPA